MFVDHFGCFFVSSQTFPVLNFVCRFIGRLTAPIMCYFLVQGYLFTSSRKNYFIRLLSFGIISQIPFSLATNHTVLSLNLNMIFQLASCFLILYSYENIKNYVLKTFVIVVLFLFSVNCDWSFFAPLMVMVFYLSKDDFKKMLLSFTVLVVLISAVDCIFLLMNGYKWYGELWQLGLFLFIPVICLYNGECGKKSFFNKWFFYAVYPLHLLIIWIFKVFIV